MDEVRLNRLARRLDAVAEQDELRVQEETRIGELRRECAFELYAICSNLVRSLNAQATKGRVELAPPSYSAESFQDSGPNLFQLNASGRIIDIAFEVTDQLFSTEDFETPYTLVGAIRWFNQDSLEGLGIYEQLLFLCEKEGELQWTHFDPITHREGLVDEDYLMGLLETILR